MKTAPKSSRVQSNLIQQNCYIRDCSPAVSVQSPRSGSTFTTLDEVSDEKGIHFEESQVPYPITPQYVNSFVDSSDYRKDPAQAISNGSNRHNLGDVSAIQHIMSMSDGDVRALYEQLKTRFSKLPAKTKTGDSEVNNNG
ncbi:hypothetical protein [Peromfec virus RodF8_38]|uniref:Uncharacterized protein n=1 Tax=Peromfec virus RodF8_38 TaxID=2929373 RepID=A0A976N2M3_9VIRU|nr:hypothetical protein [Peromfec virus RodF8_38]